MKRPKLPVKPYPPYKPQPPPKYVDENTTLATITLDEYSAYTLASLEDLIRSEAPGVAPADVRIEFEIEKEPTYYDETIITLKAKLFTQRQIENPRYAALDKHFLSETERYKEDMLKHKAALKQYKKDMAVYQSEYDKYNLESSKNQIKRLEKKLKEKSK